MIFSAPHQKAPRYLFTQNWFAQHIQTWQKTLRSFEGMPRIQYLEVGAFEGRSLVWMLENILTDPTSSATCIDLALPHYRGRLINNIKATGQSHRVQLIESKSTLALRTLPREQFHIIYLDGDHRGHEVLSDAVLSWELLKPGGVLIFDDYLWKPSSKEEQTPKKAIDAFLDAYGTHLKVTHHGYQIIIQKKKSYLKEFQPKGLQFSWNQKRFTRFKVKTSQKLLYDGLLKAFHLSKAPRFRKIHEIARASYQNQVAPALQLSLPKQLKELNPRIEVRNSVEKQESHFNIFFSDLDFSLILSSTPSPKQNQSLQRWHRNRKRLLPFLGEMEIYTERERELRSKIEGEIGPLIELFWSLRKVIWMTSVTEENPYEYHRRKARGAIVRCLSEISDRVPQLDKHPFFYLTHTFQRKVESTLQETGISIPQVPPVKYSVFDVPLINTKFSTEIGRNIESIYLKRSFFCRPSGVHV